MSYCGVNQCPPIPYQDASSWLGKMNQACTEACFLPEPGMETHPGRRLRHPPEGAELLERHSSSTVEECAAECRRRTDCAALEVTRDGVCTLLRDPVGEGLLTGLKKEAGSTVMLKATHHQQCAVQSMSELVECTAVTEGLSEEERWTDAECNDKCSKYVSGAAQCPKDNCRCRRALAPVLQFQDGSRQDKDLSRMCCQYCASSTHLGALECSQVADPAVCDQKQIRQMYSPCGLCVSNFNRTLHIPHYEKKLRQHLDRVAPLEQKLVEKQEEESHLQHQLEKKLRRHSPSAAYRLDPVTCQSSDSLPDYRPLRHLAQRYARSCQHRNRVERHLERIHDSIDRETDDLLQRKTCLAQCEPTCTLEQDPHTCAAGRLRCREGADSCTEELCAGSCTELLGNTPLCSWEGCSKLSQNTCTSDACKALTTISCTHCPDPMLNT